MESDEKRIIKLLEKQMRQLDRIEKLLLSVPKGKKFHEKSPIKQVKSPKPTKMTVPAMLLLFKADKFFDEPKTLSQIVQKFKEESRTIPATGLTLPLQRLVRSRELARILKNGKWSYVNR
ncbi:MAG TPA: hypothetical protein VGR54_07160 [Nitrosopumilaceae archaeon]|nr:hypothetical protein [Nitrosopumilaceae archaeon]